MNPGTTTSQTQQDACGLPDSLNAASRLTLTVGGTRGWQTFKGVFVSRYDKSKTFQATLTRCNEQDAIPVVQPGDRVGVAYRVGNRKCMFSSPLVSLAWTATKGEIVLGWPDQVHHLRRRCFERAIPPRGKAIMVRMTAGEASSSSVCPVPQGRILDISVGGLRLAVDELAPYDLGATYRCAFTARTEWGVTVFDAIVRHRGQDDHGQSVLGLQVVGLETMPDSGAAMERLARVVSHFQQAASQSKH